MKKYLSDGEVAKRCNELLGTNPSSPLLLTPRPIRSLTVAADGQSMTVHIINEQLLGYPVEQLVEIKVQLSVFTREADGWIEQLRQ